MNRSAIAFARGAPIGVRMIWMSSAVNTASKDVVNLLSRSRIRNRNRSARSPRSMSRLRACWVTQAPVGWAVIPGRCTWRRRARSQRGYRGGAGTQCRRGRNPRRGSRGPARTGTAARSAETVGAPDGVPRSSRSPRRSRRPRYGRVRPAHPGSFGSPIGDSRGPSSAPGPGSAVRWAVGPLVGGGRSSGGRRAGRASATAFGARPAAPAAAGRGAVCSAR